jgi:HAD superfamily hydrolase (TIGR01549 family)
MMLTWSPPNDSTLKTHSIGSKQRQPTMKKQNVKVRGVFFDWDLTLARTVGDVSADERLVALFRSQGLSYSLAEIEAAVQHSQTHYRQRFAQDMPRPQSQEEIAEHYKRILNYLKYESISDDLLEKLYNGYARLPTFLYEDALPTLRALDDRDISLGIISNHTRVVRYAMQQLVGELIPDDQIFISQEVGLHKPSPPIFSLALQLLYLSPEETLFVGDSLDADAIGAVELGNFRMGLWLDREDVGADVKLPPRVARITSLNDVLNFV